MVNDIPPLAAKTGALGNAAIIETIANRAATFSFPLVVDPVMVSKHGVSLLDDDAVRALKRKLLPNAFLVTPNLPEAPQLAEMEVTDLRSMEKAAAAISRLGAKSVLVKGGHLDGDPVDLLFSTGHTLCLLAEPSRLPGLQPLFPVMPEAETPVPPSGPFFPLEPLRRLPLLLWPSSAVPRSSRVDTRRPHNQEMRPERVALQFPAPPRGRTRSSRQRA